MRNEIEYAASFWRSKLDPSLGTLLLAAFENELVNLLAEKFSSHWYENEPHRGQAYREICCDFDGHVDNILLTAALNIKFDFYEFYQPQRGIRMWIDPGEVEVCFTTPPYQNCVIYSKKSNNLIENTSSSNYHKPTYYNYDADQFYLSQGKISPPLPSYPPYANYSKPMWANGTVYYQQPNQQPYTIKTS